MTEREKMELGMWYDANNDEELLKFYEDELAEYHKDMIKEEFKKSFLSYLDRNRKYNIENGGNSMAKMTVYHGGNTSRKKHKRFWNGVLLYGYKGTGSKMGEKI